MNNGRRYQEAYEQFLQGEIGLFYKEVYPSLLVFTRRLLPKSLAYLAEDCVQEAIYRVYQSRRQFDTPLQMRSFLFTCIHNEIITIFRKSDRKERFLETRETIDNTLIDELVLQETLDRLYLAIDQLPDQLHRIFVLSFDEGLRHKEIAAILQLSPHTVKKQKAKLIQLLREHFKDDATMLFLLAVI